MPGGCGKYRLDAMRQTDSAGAYACARAGRYVGDKFTVPDVRIDVLALAIAHVQIFQAGKYAGSDLRGVHYRRLNI
jgi:hypothetical protein